jgi:hypothetical protein
MDRAMLRDIGLPGIALLFPALLWSGDPGRCQLSKGLYEDRLTLVQKQGPADSPATGALLAPGSTGSANRLSTIDDEYRLFFAEIASATQSNDSATLKSCCDHAANDRAGALVCRLSLYLDGGRKDSSLFLEQFPSTRKEYTMLLDLNSLAGGAGTNLFPPKGPGYRLIDELFLLVMDQRDIAITRYFNLAAQATGDEAAYMDGQIRVFLKEAPAVVVNQWLVLRRYRPKLKSAAQAVIASSTPAQMQGLVKAVRSFCDKSNPDCPDILKLYAGK